MIDCVIFVMTGAAHGRDVVVGEIFDPGLCGWAIRKRENRGTQETS